MAKKRGITGTVSAIWRLLIWGLAAVLVFAIWLGWSSQTAPPSETTAEALGEEEEVATEEATDAGETDDAATEEAADAGEPATEETADAGATPSEGEEDTSVLDTAIERLDEATQSDAEALTEEAEAEAAAERAEPDAPTEPVTVEDNRPGPETELESTDPAEAAVSETASETIVLALLGNVELSLPGDDARYRFIDAIRRNGRIEVTTARTLNGETTETTRLLACDPLAAGIVARDGGERTESPEMTVVEDGTVDAMIARAVCDALN